MATTIDATGFKGRSLVSIQDFSRSEIERVLDTAQILGDGRTRHLEGCQVALLFYEASTRTRNSFLTALHHLGGTECGFSSGEGSSVQKGESLADTIRMFASYCEGIVLRHPRDGSARWAADVSRVPVINAGDGKNQHPTQTLLDLYAMRNTQGRLQNLSVGMMGDLKYGRTVHSLVEALSLYPGNELHLISPPSLAMPEHYLNLWREKGLGIHLHSRLETFVPEVDVLYCTRIQRERMPDDSEYEKVRGLYRLVASHLKDARPNLRVLHPLPRVDEIHTDVDETPYAYYFEQAAGGVPIRKALLWLLLGLGEPGKE
jgi:aspartate carbamoyltransferase catalytic subunit